MRLSLVCLFKKTVNGHIFRGKDRLVKRVSKKAMDTLVKEYERQEANMLLLRHPYLSPVRRFVTNRRIYWSLHNDDRPRITCFSWFYFKCVILLQEESSGHTKELNKRAKLVAIWNSNRLKTQMKPHVTIEDRLNHLKVKDQWDW